MADFLLKLRKGIRLSNPSHSLDKKCQSVIVGIRLDSVSLKNVDSHIMQEAMKHNYWHTYCQALLGLFSIHWEMLPSSLAWKTDLKSLWQKNLRHPAVNHQGKIFMVSTIRDLAEGCATSSNRRQR